MKKVFLFRNVRVDSVKVSHAFTVGLPSLTGLTGLASAFAAELARAVGLRPTELVNAGVLLGMEHYKLHEGYKKVTEKAASGAGLATRALASAYASFTAHLVLEVEGTTPAADEALNNFELRELARDVLRGLRLCGASLLDASNPVNLDKLRAEDFGGERLAALALLPSKARVLVDASYVVAEMRDKGIPLMEGLITATMPHYHRPGRYKAFFEDLFAQLGEEHQHTFGAVHNGYLLVGDAKREAVRPSFDGEYLPVQVASPTHTLVRLQLASSVRSTPPDAEGQRVCDWAFWRMQPAQGGYLCCPALPA